MTIIIFSLTLYFLICILFFGFFVCCFLDCTLKALLMFFDCRGLAYSCVIIGSIPIDDVYEHTTIFIIIGSII